MRRLRGAYLDGALSTRTFELRVATAYRSRSDGELAALLSDLPSRVTRLRATLRGRLDGLRAARGVAPAPVIEVTLPDVPGRRLTVGRSSRCDIVIDDPAVSRLHLEIRHAAGRWQAWDLGSTNGTHLAGRRVSTADVAVGTTEIRIRGG